jgi:hypothetical protein
MSMMPPPFNASSSDEGIPAADAGAGAPEPAPGFGLAGEDPDTVPPEDPQPEEAQKADDAAVESTFRTPDPTRIGPQASAPAEGPATS